MAPHSPSNPNGRALGAVSRLDIVKLRRASIQLALTKKGNFRFGDSQFDIREELQHFSKNGYPSLHFADAICICGNTTFQLSLDDNEGVAVRICTICNAEHPIGDSAEFLEDAELEECECPCGANEFEVTAGVAPTKHGEDVKWLYIGCRCVRCGLTACYGDWKNEFGAVDDFLKLI